MKICPDCKSPLEDSVKVCPYCDMKQPEASAAPAEPVPVEAPVLAEEPAPAEEPVQALGSVPAEDPRLAPDDTPEYDLPVEPVQPAAPVVPVQTPAPVPVRDAAETPEERGLAKASMILGIISLAVGGIAGIILGAIGLKKSNQYVATRIKAHGMALAGRILSRLGLIFGIVSAIVTFLYVIYMLFFFFIMIRYNLGGFERFFDSIPRF